MTFAGGAGPLTVPLSAGRPGRARRHRRAARPRARPIDTGVLAATRYPPYAVVPRQYALGKPVPWQAAAQPPLRYDRPAGTAHPAAGAAARGRPADPAAVPGRAAAPDRGQRGRRRTGTAGRPGQRVEGGPGRPDPDDGDRRLRLGHEGRLRAAPGTGPRTLRASRCRTSTRCSASTRTRPRTCSSCSTTPAARRGGSDTLTLALLYPLSRGHRAPGPRCGRTRWTRRACCWSRRTCPPSPTRRPPRQRRCGHWPCRRTARRSPPATMSPADARDFLTLLWEAAVTNTGGYYLYYRVGQDGPGLPAEIFNQDPTATVSLLVTAFPAPAAAAPRSRCAPSTTPRWSPTTSPTRTPRCSRCRRSCRCRPPSRPGDAGRPRRQPRHLAARHSARPTRRPPTCWCRARQITVGSASHLVQPGDDILAVALALGVTHRRGGAGRSAPTRGTSPPARLAEVYPEWLTVRGTAAARRRRVPAAAHRPGPGRPGGAAAAVRPPQDPQDPARGAVQPGRLPAGRHAGGFRASADGLPAGPARPTSGPLNHQLTAVGGVEPWIYEKQLRIDRFATEPAVRRPRRAAGPVRRRRHPGPVRLAAAGRLRQPAAGPAGHRRRRRLHRRPGGAQPVAVGGHRLPVRRPARRGHRRRSASRSTPAPTSRPRARCSRRWRRPAPPACRSGSRRRPRRTGTATPPIFWQLSHDLAAEVTTTVDDTRRTRLDVAALAAFASGAWSYLATVAGTTQLTATTAARDTLASIAATYQVSPAELAQANRSAAQSFAAASLLTPIATIAVEQPLYGGRRTTRWPGSPSARPVPADPAGLAAGNPALALQPGTCSPSARCGPSRPATRWPVSRPRRAWTAPSWPARTAR